MSPPWRVRVAGEADVTDWLAMRMQLWPDEADVASPQDLQEYLHAPDRAVALLALDDDTPIGFIEANLRTDYVNGTESSPVGFVEGLYVAPAYRRRGVGRALIAAVERWTQARGCSELAFDALIDNATSHAAHRAYGFEETERVVYFRKRVDA